MLTFLLEIGADIRFIQAMLGRAKLDATQIYTQVSVKKLKEVHAMVHPAKLKRAKRVVWDDGEEEPMVDKLLEALEVEAEG